ncbi:hypothetical protein M436DRAFT_53288 [Aureobasidium namibiae CBS 147.97]|uniref:Integral membrane protein n=1 Tax=Aureobasidium namibiae CBS 147.97 TaxID=1043004 RepID=A0A074WL52_9PEZI
MAPVQANRNNRFTGDRQPLRSNDDLQLIQSRVQGPITFLNPTQASFEHAIHKSTTGDLLPNTTTPLSTTNSVPPTEVPKSPAANFEYKWTARDNRKGRHTLVIKSPSVEQPEANVATPRSTTHWQSIIHTVWLMITFYPVWDISWCVAYVFTLGSVLWVVNSFFVFLPLMRPSSTFHNEALVGGGVTAFIGATVFVVGSMLLMLEAVNENREGCFGYAVESAFEGYVGKVEKGRGSGLKIVARNDMCTHHHRNKANLVGKPHRTPHNTPSGRDSNKQHPVKTNSWIWCPSWIELKTHYFHELGFIASLSQLIAATIFWISGFTALPGIMNKLSPGLSDGVFWTPQVIGGSGFILSGWLFMIESQKHWWQPAPKVLGWHIGFWNLIGGFGFTLCPAFGFDASSWAQYQASCSTFWGSWAFLIGSLIQLYESLEKTPVRYEGSA